MITFKKANEIVENSDVFYRKNFILGGYEVAIFNYRLADYQDFIVNDALELRGLTFVNKDNHWERHLALPKFFNIQENPSTQLEVLRNKTIDIVYDKLDGSLVQPILLPDGNIYWKSKATFFSIQAINAGEWALATGLNDKIKPFLQQGYSLVFEYVSPFNQIVLLYENTELVLLQIRDKEGNFVTKEFMTQLSTCKFAKTYNYSLEELLEKKHKEEGKEGWVVSFTDGTLVKIKTDWYIKLHGSVANPWERVHLLAQLALDDELDDVKTLLEDSPVKDYVVMVEEVVRKRYNHIVDSVVSSIKKARDINMSKKDYALAHNGEETFGIVMQCWWSGDIEKCVEQATYELLCRKFQKLDRAKEFLGIG